MPKATPLQSNPQEVIVDIVSDVVCPWCVIGYKRLEVAASKLADKATITIRWHPFELTPDMSEQGENLRDFLAKKYGNAFNGSDDARKMLTTLGNSLGFSFNYHENSMRYNSFRAHQLLHHSRQYGLEHKLKIQLFIANFTEGKNISDINVLVDVAQKVGLNGAHARDALKRQRYIQAIREEQRYWQDIGVHAIPLFVFNQSAHIQGAPEESTFREKILEAITHTK